MFRVLMSLVVVLLFPTVVMAKFVAVLETGSDAASRELLSDGGCRYITNVLREQAIKALPASQNFTIMTRENINAMLPPGKSIEECEGSCLAETGRNIAADYIAQARIESVGGTLALSAEMYETATNKLIASFNGRGSSLDELLAIAQQNAPSFFLTIKASGSYTGSGFGDFSSAGAFDYQGSLQYVVEIVSSPAGAIPSIDGKANSKCLATPCRVQVSAGNHLFVVTKDRYLDAELSLDITQNNQKVGLSLKPNFGYLELKPQLTDNYGNAKDLVMSVDGKTLPIGAHILDPGVHKVHVEHPCYDALDFNAGIEREKKLVFDRPLNRGVGALELNTEWNGQPQSVPVYVDGKVVGNTPYSNQVPLCAKISVGEADFQEAVPVELKWHQVSQMTYALKNKPKSVIEAEKDSLDSVRTRAEKAYRELDGSESLDKPHIDTGVKPEMVEHGVHWLPVGISSAVAVAGVVTAIVGNNNAKKASERDVLTEDDYKRNKSDVDDAQLVRSIGIGIAILGAVGIGISFAF